MSGYDVRKNNLEGITAVFFLKIAEQKIKMLPAQS